MNSSPVITVQNVSKLYQLGERRLRYKTLRDSIAESVMRGFRPAHVEKEKQVLWALRDVSFNIHQGEVVGLIGRNGAGKSTMLKILSEITYPTEGRVDIHGRVGSLLEVGTGFHPELTGRENIFLNGAILGMTRVEIRRKFDEIVAFAEVEDFIDTPVKRYSSGMHVRLAFAVAAHLEPEILLVDEVLAVGDAQFQKKCLGKMSDVAHGHGRTIIFVSHNMAAVESLCSRCLLIDAGCLAADGPTETVIAGYQSISSDMKSGWTDLGAHPGRRRNATPIMKRVSLLDGEGQFTSAVRMGAPLSVQVSFDTGGKPLRPFFGVAVKSLIGAPVFSIDNRIIPGFVFEAASQGTISCCFPHLPLMPGTYVLDLYLGDEHLSIDAVFDAVAFDVTPSDVFSSGKLPHAHTGSVFCPATWVMHPADPT